MSDQVEYQKAINELGQSTTEAITALQEKSMERFDKLAEKSADAIQKCNDLRMKMEASEKWQQDFEKRLVRPNAGSFSPDKELENTYLRSVFKGFRTRSAASQSHIVVDTEITDKYLDSYIAKQYPLIDAEYRPSIKKDMSEGSNVEGGYWVFPPDRSSTTIQRTFETTPMRMLASVATTSVNDFQFVIDDQEAANGGWPGETAARPVTGTPEIGLLDIPINETYANVRATQRIIDDVTFPMETWLVGKTTSRMDRVQNSAFVVGDGSLKPTGILDYPAWTGNSVIIGDDTNYERGALEYIISGLDGEPTYEGLVNTQNALLQNYQGNATWLMHRTTWGQILQLVSDTDFPLINPQMMLRDGAPEILLGRPVVFGSDVPQGGVADSKSIIYGDFRIGYTIVDRLGYRTIRDNVTEKPYVLFYTTLRVGGALTSYQSLKVNIFSTNVGPVTAGVPLLASKKRSDHLVREKAAKERLEREVKKIKDARKSKEGK